MSRVLFVLAQMQADLQSLAELGLLSDASGAWPLASWLDHTHARSGHEALTRLIATPLTDVDAIRARQALLPQLVPLAAEVPWKQLYALALQVEDFLNGKFVLVPRGPASRLFFRVQYGHIVTWSAGRLRSVGQLLALCEPLAARLATLGGDAAFAQVGSAFRVAVADTRARQLREAIRGGRSDLALVAHDAMMRERRSADESTTHDRSGERLMRELLRSLVAAVAQLDAFCSLALASAQVRGAVPLVTARDEGRLILGGVRHPLLDRGVANDVAMEERQRVVFLTGPNMAGKSTLLRSVGIAVYCTHLGMAVAASRAQVPMYDRLLVSITVRDNLQRGVSLYLAEVRRVRTIVDAVDSGDAVLAIVDEAFRGTNVRDAADATALLVKGLAHAHRGTFVIASHLAEVAERCRGHDGITCWCMEVEMESGVPHFTYRATRGVSDVHLGMVLLDAEGVGPVLRRMSLQAGA